MFCSYEAVGRQLQSHGNSTGVRNCFWAGTLGAAGFTLFFSLLRFLDLTRLNVERGIGSRLFASSAAGTLLGLFCFLLSGGVLGLIFRLVLRACRWNGVIPGAVLGVAFWFFLSILIGTFSNLDILTPRGEDPIGPFGVFEGQLTFYCLLFVHIAYGALIGWSLAQATPKLSRDL
jgi:uncharacterized BrkB/YihY/UPF0761 family membrane protein